VVSPIAAEEGKCEERSGAEVTKEGVTSGVEVCSGEPGAPGEPWTPNNTLPPGAVETGAWSFNATEANGSNIIAAISFPIKLEARLGEEEVHFQPPASAGTQAEQEFKAFCQGNAVNPKPTTGNLCVYYTEGEITNATFTEIDVPYLLEEPGAGLTGAIIRLNYSGGPGGTARGFGTWAVKAAEP